MRRKYFKLLILLSLGSLILIPSGSVPASAEKSEVPGGFSPALTTYQLINEEYLGSEGLDRKELAEGAVEGMLEVAPEGYEGGFTGDEFPELRGQGASEERLEPAKDLKPAVEVYQDILDEASPEKKIEKTELLKRAMSGMLDVLGDEYSAVYTKEEFKEYQRRHEGNYVGLGMKLGKSKSEAKVLETYPGSPASRSPINPGDLVKKIDGKRTKGMSFQEITEALAGEEGTKVELRIRDRDGGREDVTLTRREIKIPPVEYEGEVIYPPAADDLGIPLNEIWISEKLEEFERYLLYHEIREIKYRAEGYDVATAHEKAVEDEKTFAGDPNWERLRREINMASPEILEREADLDADTVEEVIRNRPYYQMEELREVPKVDKTAYERLKEVFWTFYRV